MSFFKSFFASCLGALVALVLFAFLGIMLISGLAASVGTEEATVVNDHSVLVLRLNAPITELEVEDPVAELFPGAANQSLGLIQLRQTLKRAKNDPHVDGIYLQTGSAMAGITTLSEVRDAMLDFRNSGKWIVAYATEYTEGGYYLASAADKVYLHPEGMVEFNGLAAEVTFFKKLFDNLEIKPEVFRVGEFKSAVEPFLRENLSEENKLQLNSMLKSIHGEMVRAIADSRKVEPVRLKEIADKMLVRSAQQAQSYELVDSLLYEDGVNADIRQRLGLDTGDNISFVKYGKYKKSAGTGSGSGSNEIAVIVADGSIVTGKSDQGMVGDVTMTDALRKAAKNSKVKAIVLRVNSPGGSFMASDVMWHEIKQASAKKPVIASMGDYAASGGYYLAMACDTIVAKPTTVTGSIGIFSVMFDLSKFLDHKLGITSEEVKTGEIGDLITVTRSLTNVEKDIWQKQTDHIYEVFTGKAAEGRHMTQADIKKIASGRVWTGEEAKGNGLVDVLGGIDEAVRIAADKAGVGDDYKLRYYPHQKTFLEKFMNDKDEEAVAKAIAQTLGDESVLYRQWLRLRRYQGAQARMPFEFEIH